MNRGADSKEVESALSGRAVFVVESTSAGVAIHTALLTVEGQVIPMVGIFPDEAYALEQVEQLKELVVTHFAQMASVVDDQMV